ncbi:intraflagellar transport protein 43 homolog isoform X2 [Convolutriloba macropyga]|uniref:intraflagellar transport protein 43 homolog isoform X2 n=1 Tax=Convolutriloba macropyga TaxID=536237 RepID=UPI003F51FE18
MDRPGRRPGARRRAPADLEGLDFLKQGQAEEDQAFEGRSVNVNSNTVTESNNKNSYQHAGEKGGWGSEEQNDQKMVDQRLQRSGTDAKGIQDDEAEEDDDIPVIPTLDDMQEREFSSSIAAAPSAAVQIASMNELENALQKHSAMFTLDNEIDLKSLARFALSPEAEVVEDDRKWDWNILFTQVTSELRADMERSSAGISGTSQTGGGDTKNDGPLADLL